MPGRPASLAAWVAASAFACALLVAHDAAAQGSSFPAIQAIEGIISPSKAANPLVPASTDELIIFNTSTNRRQSAPFSIDNQGNYLVVISSDSSLNGTILQLRLRKETDVFGLLDADGTPAQFVFFGSLFAERIELNARIGPRVGSAGPSGPGEPQRPVNTNPDAVDCPSANFDVNGDGKCDEADIEQIHAFLRDNPPGPERTPLKPSPPEDVNGDGFVNVRDVLESVRALQRARVDAARKGIAAERGKIERPTAPARPTSDAPSEMEAARARARERPQ